MAIIRQETTISTRGAHVGVSVFTSATGQRHYHIMVQCTDPRLTHHEQVECVRDAFLHTMTTLPPEATPVFKRYFLSDPANQFALLPIENRCAVSVVGQAPLNGTKLALWAVCIDNAQVEPVAPRMWMATAAGRKYVWMGTASAPGLDSHLGTRCLLDQYASALKELGMTLADNCMRTWFFVRDIDVNYKGVVDGRNQAFAEHGLTPATHFIASTGIGADTGLATVPVVMDAYAIANLLPVQVRYLHARDFLNSTIEYGVAFERGTAIDLEDCRQVLISGTASIDNQGQVLHLGDVRLQAERMLQNVEALLAEAACKWDDVMHIIVYLRDIADYAYISEMLRKRFPDMPMVIVQAPVCRPGWLIEMECAALRQI